MEQGGGRVGDGEFAVRESIAVPGSRWASGAREIALAVTILAVYLVVTRRVQVSHSVADAHGRLLLDVERALHVDVERPLNGWLSRHHTLGALAAWEYATTYIATTFGFLAWLWWRRPAFYRWARDVLVATTLLAIGCFALWPLTPPRLLPHASFSDVVASNHPFLSWGSGTVSAGADQWAAMPSLHEGWAVWVTVASLRSGAGTAGRALAGAHLAVTSYVVVATGNHYVLDIVAGVAVVGLAMLAYAGWRVAAVPLLGFVAPLVGRPARLPELRTGRVSTVDASDAFFVHVALPEVPQVVGGVALVDTSGRRNGVLDVEDVRAHVARRLPRLLEFRRVLDPGGAVRRPRWIEVTDVDVRWHVRRIELPPDAGRRGLEQLVAQLSSRPLDLARPPWRLWVVDGVGPIEAAVVVLVHHAVGDGLGVVDVLRHLLDPPIVAEAALTSRTPGPLARVAAGALGVAQLALDGRAQRLPFAGKVGPNRAWRTLDVPLAHIRDIAKASGTRVTDVLLAAFGEVIGEVVAHRGTSRDGARLRVAVPLSLRSSASPTPCGAGNLTSAMRLDVPLDRMPAEARLRAVHLSGERGRRASRLFATTAVVRGIGVLPPALHARAARAMYRSRYFSAILTNMPGPAQPMSFVGSPLKDVYPVIPLADGVPLAVGTLGWNGWLCLSVTADPGLLPEVTDIDDRLRRALDRLADGVRCDVRVGDDRFETWQSWQSSSP